MSYDVGQKVRLPVTVRDTAGTLTDTTMAVAVLRPDGTAYPAGAVQDDAGLGAYYVDVVPDQTGVWQWQYTASGVIVAVYTGQFFVREAGVRLVSLVEAKRHLNKDLAVTTDDDEIRDWIDATTYLIENRVGPIVPRTVTDILSGHGSSLTLRTGPVLSITSITETWGPGDIRTLTAELPAGPYGDNDYTVDLRSRIIFRRSGGTRITFPYGSANITVTYRVGRTPTPQNVRMAALELVGHYWRASQLASGSTRPREGTSDAALVGIALPNRVVALLGNKKAPRLVTF